MKDESYFTKPPRFHRYIAQAFDLQLRPWDTTIIIPMYLCHIFHEVS